MIVEIIILFLLILLNGALVISETAVISSRKPRLQYLANNGDHRARVALELAQSPDSFLSTVTAGITLISIVAGAFGGAALSDETSAFLSGFPLIAPYAGPAGMALVVITITLFTLFIGELIPKQLATRNPEAVASAMAYPIRWLTAILHPIVWLLTRISGGVIRLLGVTAQNDPSLTEEEIKVMLDEGTKAGAFHEAEQEMVERVFRLADLSVNALMTPRTEIVWLDADDPTEENLAKIKMSSHTFFPLCRGNIDTVLGIVHVKDLFSASLSAPITSLLDHLRGPLYLVENMPAVQLIEKFRESSTHCAFLVDEYGGIQGLVTLNDILKAVVGDGNDSAAGENENIVQRADGSYLADGALLISEFQDFFHLGELSEEETGNYQTLAGFTINHMGRIPSAGQFFVWRDLRIEVVDMDGNRVDKLLISKRDPGERP